MPPCIPPPPFPNVGVDARRYLKDVLQLELTRALKGAAVEEDAGVRKLKLDADTHLLRLIMLACKRDRAQRVLDLCRQLQLPSSWDGALKVVLHAKMVAVAERIAQMKEAMLASGTAS